MRFGSLERRIHTVPERPKRPGLRVDLHGKPFNMALIEKETVAQTGYILFENAAPDHMPTHAEGEFSTLVGELESRRAGVQFPHRDNAYDPNPTEILILHSIGQSQAYPGIEDSQNPVAGPDRPYVEPYTFVCDAEELWEIFVRYIKAKPLPIKERIINALKNSVGIQNDKHTDKPHFFVEEFRAAINQSGVDKVGQTESRLIDAPTRTWKELFFAGLFADNRPLGQPKVFSDTEVRAFVLHAIDSGKVYLHSWKPNQVLAIDNTHMMHGVFDLTGKGGDPNFKLSRGYIKRNQQETKVR